MFFPIFSTLFDIIENPLYYYILFKGGLNMSKGRHSANNSSNNSSHKFNILPVFIFLIIVIILLLLYHFRDSIYTFFNSQNSKNTSSKVENTIFSNELLMRLYENLEVVMKLQIL